MSEQMETWKNVSKGTTWIRRMDPMHKPIDEIVHPGMTIRITPEDREAQMSQAADETLDIFRNGILQPVKLIEGHEDTAELLSNPNMIGEGDISDLFKLHWRKFETQIASMTNPALLTRILEVAMESGTTTVKQMETIKGRILELDPGALVEKGQVAPPIGNFDGATA